MLIDAIRAVGGGYKPRLVFTSSIAVFGAPFPDAIGDEFFHTPLIELRHPEGDRRTAARRLHAQGLPGRHRHPPADHLRPAGPAEQGGLRLLLQHHARAAGRQGGGAAGLRGRPPLARLAALGGRLPAARRRPWICDAMGPRRNLTMPGLSATVGEQIAALKRVAGENVVARIKREPDPFIIGIVDGWPRNFDTDARAASSASPRPRRPSTTSSGFTSRTNSAASSSPEFVRKTDDAVMTLVACIGECMIELQAGAQAAGCIRAGYGGDTLNTAVYLARLGIGCRLRHRARRRSAERRDDRAAGRRRASAPDGWCGCPASCRAST